MSRKKSIAKRSSSQSRKSRQKETRVLHIIQGTVQMTRDGSIFVKSEELGGDVHVKPTKGRGALNGDTVEVKVTGKSQKGDRFEGEVSHIIKRTDKPFVGVLHIVGRQAWVLMQSKTMPFDISVPMVEAAEAAEDTPVGTLVRLGGGEYSVSGVYETIDGKASPLKARTGMKVAAIVDGWARGESTPHGHLADVLGEMGENDTEMHAILAEFGLPYRFEPDVENAARKISDKITSKDLEGRRDFRDTLTFTIDPADAKDFDDALSFRKLDNGNIEVGVHIADVSYYVTPGSAVDKEAQSRGTSVYLVDRTVPMLPENLSNKLCSLRPGEDKLTFSAVFEMSPEGKVESRWFGRTVMRSDYRFAYETAQQVIDMGAAALEADLRGGSDKVSADGISSIGAGVTEGVLIPKEIKEAILMLWDIAKVLRNRRFAAGAISFERAEMKVLVDEKGVPVRVFQKISREANWLIEEFMLLANRSVAEFVATGGKMDGKARKSAKTFVYRVHDVPNPDKLFALGEFAGNFGYRFAPGDGSSVAGQLNSLLGAAKDKPEFMALEMLALRSMAKACYSTDNIGHYGLAFKFYTHFTSPIRRYPDLMVHRLLAMYLADGKSQEKEYYEAECLHASEREVIAANAERDSIKYKLVEFMEDKVGQEFDGHISGVTDWGIYVEIEPTKIEGMVALRDIKSDFFEYDEKSCCVRGRRKGKVLKVGDEVRIKVKATNLEQRLLDYELVEEGINSSDTAQEAAEGGHRSGRDGNGNPVPAGSNRQARKDKIHAAIKASKQRKARRR